MKGTAFFGVALVFVVVAAGCATSLASSRTSSDLSIPDPGTLERSSVLDRAATALEFAARSLSEGAGPAHGQPWACSGIGTSQLDCVPQSSATPQALPKVAATPTWTNLTAVTAPAKKSYASMTYDDSDGYVLLFGGLSISAYPMSDTWIFSNEQWINITSTAGTPPSARFGMGMTYDAADGYVLAFGGSGFGPCPGTSNDNCNDTWSFHAGSWNKLAIFPAPPATWGMGMTYDAADEYVLLFGGQPDAGTWNYSHGTWTQIADPSNSSYLQPSPREGMGMAYDALDGYVLLFGGYGNNAVLGDTWKFAAGVWAPITTSPSSPSARERPMMAYDDATGSVLLFGGFTYFPDPEPYGPLNDTWSFRGGTWTNITSGFSPRARGEGMMVYDLADSCVLLFGGMEQLGQAGNQNDTWSWCAAPPLVGLSIVVAPTMPLPGVAAAFAASVRGGVTPFTYAWNFGDGSTSTSAAPQHAYTSAGYYAVHLWLNDSAGHAEAASQLVHAYVPLAAPGLAASPNPAVLGQPVNFTSAEGGGTPPYTYAWDFGDGGTGGNLSNITHVYTTNGPFQTKLTVLDSVGAVVHAFLNITIQLQALTQSTTTTGSPPLQVSFTGGAQGGQPPYSYSWNFGDGTPVSTVQNPTHIFALSGTYTVVLTVADAKGNHSSSSILVQIGGAAPISALALEMLIGGAGFAAGVASTLGFLTWRRRKDRNAPREDSDTKTS